MTMRASRPPVTCAMCATAASMLWMSPVWLVPLNTPQSTTMCSGAPFSSSRLTRKKSPKPTRYIRTRTPASPAAGIQAPARAAWGLRGRGLVAIGALEHFFRERLRRALAVVVRLVHQGEVDPQVADVRARPDAEIGEERGLALGAPLAFLAGERLGDGVAQEDCILL